MGSMKNLALYRQEQAQPDTSELECMELERRIEEILVRLAALTEKPQTNDTDAYDRVS